MPHRKAIGRPGPEAGTRRSLGIRAPAIAILALTAGASGQTASITAFAENVFGRALSADGNIVLCGPRARRWSLDTGLVSLGVLPGGNENCTGVGGMSADGTVIVGWSATDLCGGQRAFRWTEATGMVSLGTLPGDTVSYATGVSADGAVITGFSEASDSPSTTAQPFIWTAEGGMVGLGHLPGKPVDTAWAISANGAVVVGRADIAFLSDGGEALRWSAATGLVGLGYLPGYADFSTAQAVSADGSVVVGRCVGAGRNAPFRWTASGGMENLGTLPGGIGDLSAEAVSADGSIIVGGPVSDVPAGFIWTRETGMRDFKQFLLDRGATVVRDWMQIDPLGMTPDASAFTGSATSPCGTSIAWVARLTPPSLPAPPFCYINCNCSFSPVLNEADFECFLVRFAHGDSRANCDGSSTPPVLNVNDLVCFMTRYVEGCR